MTESEFDSMEWHKGMKYNYHDKEYTILQVDFEQRMICLCTDNYNEDEWLFFNEINRSRII